MIGLDTNVLVRYVAQDDAKQSPRATTLIESLSEAKPGFVTVVSMVELVWVMQGPYQATKNEMVAILEMILRTREIIVENAEIVWNALHVYSNSKADFADCLIERTAHHANCTQTMTFDKESAKTAGMRLID